jgi:hypothetical protein
MITKKNLITTIQVQLAGGDAPADVQGVYHPITIQNEIGVVFDDLVSDNPTVAEDMALEFAITVSSTTPYTATLSKPPTSTNGVYNVEAGTESYNIVSPDGWNQLRKINPNGRIVKLSGSTLTFSHNPMATTGTVLMIPSFRTLAQDDPIVLERNLTKLCDMVVQRLRQREIQEKSNNSVRDIPNVRARK